MHKAARLAGGITVVVCGDFNAPNRHARTMVKGRELLQDAINAGFNLVTGPSQPTRTGTSVARDTTQDLTFVKMGT